MGLCFSSLDFKGMDFFEYNVKISHERNFFDVILRKDFFDTEHMDFATVKKIIRSPL